jgi:ribonuclease P protein component
MGLVVGKNVGNSVQRHRVSRVLRHAMPEVFTNLPSQVDVVLRALPGAAQPGRDLAADAAAATRKAVTRL